MIVQSMMLQALGAEDMFRLMRIPPFAAKTDHAPARAPNRLVTASATAQR